MRINKFEVGVSYNDTKVCANFKVIAINLDTDTITVEYKENDYFLNDEGNTFSLIYFEKELNNGNINKLKSK